jgi:hypothetical protein
VGCGVRGVGCGVWGVGCGVWGVGCGVSGVGCGVRGVGCGVWCVQGFGSPSSPVTASLTFIAASTPAAVLECCRSFVVLVGGFAFLANLLYGATVDSFHNLPSSFSTLLRFPLGDFDYGSLQVVRAVPLLPPPPVPVAHALAFARAAPLPTPATPPSTPPTPRAVGGCPGRRNRPSPACFSPSTWE